MIQCIKCRASNWNHPIRFEFPRQCRRRMLRAEPVRIRITSSSIRLRLVVCTTTRLRGNWFLTLYWVILSSMVSPTRFLDRAWQSDVKAVEEIIRLIDEELVVLGTPRKANEFSAPKPMNRSRFVTTKSATYGT